MKLKNKITLIFLNRSITTSCASQCPNMGSRNLQRLLLPLLNNTRDKGAFTLIELLVVVLIIGILAAVAVPQYQKTVEKSQATQALSIMKMLVEAQKVYFLTNGQYATQFNELDISLPWTEQREWFANGDDRYQTADTLSNENWTAQLYTDTRFANGIFIARNSGPYRGAAFVYYFHNTWHKNLPLREILCREAKSGSFAFVFQQSKGSYCQKTMNGINIANTEFYTLPK